ncbi:unnamed protein product [Caenorhabditis angaria]|uniref:Uncharacterized protein n=1 Tax=Caenorhabditis angaria TaxID=860376 RepID=A0A9P1IE91_9PELO|nr:unnamed protein product [Caenorhabditis angaria]
MESIQAKNARKAEISCNSLARRQSWPCYRRFLPTSLISLRSIHPISNLPLPIDFFCTKIVVARTSSRGNPKTCGDVEEFAEVGAEIDVYGETELVEPVDDVFR